MNLKIHNKELFRKHLSSAIEYLKDQLISGEVCVASGNIKGDLYKLETLFVLLGNNHNTCKLDTITWETQRLISNTLLIKEFENE